MVDDDCAPVGVGWSVTLDGIGWEVKVSEPVGLIEVGAVDGVTAAGVSVLLLVLVVGTTVGTELLTPWRDADAVEPELPVLLGTVCRVLGLPVG